MSERLWTAEELPQYKGRCELVDGRIIPLTPPGGEHGRTTMNVGYLLSAFVRARDLGVVFAETGFVLRRGPDTVRAPDVAFASHGRMASGIDAKFPDWRPELVVEVVSPGDSVRETTDKARMWCESGVDVAWVVDPRRREVRVFTRTADGRVEGPRTLVVGDVLDGAPALPGFTLPVADVFG